MRQVSLLCLQPLAVHVFIYLFICLFVISAFSRFAKQLFIWFLKCHRCITTPKPFLHSGTAFDFSVLANCMIDMSLTPAESQELHRLLAKAKAANAPDEFAEFSQYDPNNGVLQNPLTGETLNVWECGAMTDGSKRREDFAGDETPSGIKRQAKPKAKNMSGLGGDRNRGQPSYAMLFDEETQVPFPQASRPGDVAGSVLPPFPEGIPDVETWGKTLICFGQYKNQNMTYMDLVMATDNKALGYVKWCKSHSKSAQGHLKDLCNFMMHHSADEGISFGVFIPGTTQTRVLRE